MFQFLSKVFLLGKSNKENVHFQSVPKTISPKRPSKGLKLMVQILDEKLLSGMVIINSKDYHLIKGDSCEVLMNLRRFIRQNKKIKEISFGVDWFNTFSASGLLKVNIFTKLILLQSIRFEFLWCDSKITDESLNEMTACLQRLRFLKKVDLGFRRCRQITDIGLKSLSKCFKKLLVLRRISLEFSKCYNITNAGLLQISKSFRRLGALENIKLNFDACYFITNKGLQDLSHCLKKLVCLQSVNFDFDSCSEVTVNGVLNFIKEIAELPCLKQIGVSREVGRELESIREQNVDKRFKKGLSLVKIRGNR